MNAEFEVVMTSILEETQSLADHFFVCPELAVAKVNSNFGLRGTVEQPVLRQWWNQG